MGIENSQQGFRDFRKLIVDLVADPGSQQCKCLDQPVNMGILTLVGLELQPRRDRRVLDGEIRGHSTDKPQFTLIIRKQFILHDSIPAGRLDRHASCSRLQDRIEHNRFGIGLDAQQRSYVVPE